MVPPETPQRAGLLDVLVAIIEIGLGLLLVVYAPYVYVRDAYGAAAVDDRFWILPVTGGVLVVLLHALVLSGGGYRARGHILGASVVWLVITTICAGLFYGLALLVAVVRWGLPARAAPALQHGGAAGATLAWSWTDVVARAALGVAGLWLLGLLLGRRPRLVRAAQFVLVCAPFAVAWRMGSPLWLDAAFGLLVAALTTLFSAADRPAGPSLARALMVGGGWATAVHLFWWDWRYGIGGVAALVLGVFLADRIAKARRWAELRAIARRVSYSSTGKKCVACGREVPASSAVGGTCPHCGRVWGAAVRGG